MSTQRERRAKAREYAKKGHALPSCSKITSGNGELVLRLLRPGKPIFSPSGMTANLHMIRLMDEGKPFRLTYRPAHGGMFELTELEDE